MFRYFKQHWNSIKSLIRKGAAVPPPTTTVAEAEAATPSPFDRLPGDIVAKILGNLCTGDRARTALVCKSWRDMLMCADFPIEPEAPWLILSDDSYDKPEYSLTEISFSSLSEGMIYRFKLPNSGKYGGHRWRWCCCGSSGGWLLITGGVSLQNTVMLLWDPISGVTRNLPDLSTLTFFSRLVDYGIKLGLENISSLIARVQLFPIGSVDCVVAVLFAGKGQNHRLALATPQDHRWSVVGEGEEKRHIYKDIIFHNGKLFVSCRSLGSTTNKKANYTIRLTGCHVEVDMLRLVYRDASSDHEEHLPDGFNIQERKKTVEYLVKSSTTGELLVVSAILERCSYINLGDHGPMGPIPSFVVTRTKEFVVRRLVGDDNDNHLEKITGIGKQGLFVGAKGSFSLLTNSLNSTGVEADCIYFATDHAGGVTGVDEYKDDDDPEMRYYFVPDRFDLIHEINSDWEGAEEEENDEGDDHNTDPAMYHIVREQGVFHVQWNSMKTTSTTNLRFQSGSSAGWFTPKLFRIHP